MTRQVLATARLIDGGWQAMGLLDTPLAASPVDLAGAITEMRDRLRGAGHVNTVIVPRGDVIVAYGPDVPPEPAETSSDALQDVSEDGEVPAGLARPAGTTPRLVAVAIRHMTHWHVRTGDGRDLGRIAPRTDTAVVDAVVEVLADAGIAVGDQGAGGARTTRPHPAEDRGAGGSGEGSTRTPAGEDRPQVFHVADLVTDEVRATAAALLDGPDDRGEANPHYWLGVVNSALARVLEADGAASDGSYERLICTAYAAMEHVVRRYQRPAAAEYDRTRGGAA